MCYTLGLGDLILESALALLSNEKVLLYYFAFFALAQINLII